MGFSKLTEYLVTSVVAFIMLMYFISIFSIQLEDIQDAKVVGNPYTKSYIYDDKGRNVYTSLDTKDYYFDESHMYMLPVVDVNIERGITTIKANNYISYNTVTNKKYSVDEHHRIIANSSNDTVTIMSYIINRLNLMNREELLNTLSYVGSGVPNNLNITVDGSNTENTVIFNTERSVVK